MADVLGTLSAATALAGTIGKLVGQLSGVKDETGTVIDQLRRINDDINEARRLRYVKALNLGDHDTARIDRVIHDSTLAVLKIAKQVEPSRVGVATTGTVNLVDRFDWVSRKSSTVTGYQHNLQTCHQSLQGELGYLRQKLFVAGLAFPEQTPPPYEDIYPEVSDKHEQARRGRAHRRHGHRNGMLKGYITVVD